MRPAPLPPGDAPLLERSLAACIATILELDVAEVPAPEPGMPPAYGWRRWLNGLGLGLVPIGTLESFAWPGPWIAILTGADPAAVVMFGVPSGIAWDPADAGDGQAPALGFLLAPLDVALVRPERDAGPVEAGRIVAIALAEAAGEHAVLVAEAQAVSGRGLAGDRHAAGTGTFPSGVSGSALTLIEAEVLESFAEGGAPALSADEHRRNIVTEGVELNRLVGRSFALGEARCYGARLCEPCAHLDRYSTRGSVLRALVHRGGLRADIVEGGTIRVGDVLRVLD